MSSAPHSVLHAVTVEMIGPRTSVPVAAELRYDHLDPYAVTVAFLLGGREVTWVFGRELLMTGVHEPAGEGDVALFPSVGHDGRAVVVLELRAAEGQALVEVPARDVLRFLARTTRSVWPGTESEHVSVDDAIASILVESAG
ncbi:MAG: SsgA family sporulation/cell division regulator [Nocardioides sp.]